MTNVIEARNCINEPARTAKTSQPPTNAREERPSRPPVPPKEDIIYILSDSTLKKRKIK